MSIKAFNVKRVMIKEALESMNSRHDHMRAKVVSVERDGGDFIVFVDIENYYPYVENAWENFSKGLDFYGHTPGENKRQEINSILYNYFKDNCKGHNYQGLLEELNKVIS